MYSIDQTPPSPSPRPILRSLSLSLSSSLTSLRFSTRRWWRTRAFCSRSTCPALSGSSDLSRPRLSAISTSSVRTWASWGRKLAACRGIWTPWRQDKTNCPRPSTPLLSRCVQFFPKSFKSCCGGAKRPFCSTFLMNKLSVQLLKTTPKKKQQKNKKPTQKQTLTRQQEQSKPKF